MWDDLTLLMFHKPPPVIDVSPRVSQSSTLSSSLSSILSNGNSQQQQQHSSDSYSRSMSKVLSQSNPSLSLAVNSPRHSTPLQNALSSVMRKRDSSTFSVIVDPPQQSPSSSKKKAKKAPEPPPAVVVAGAKKTSSRKKRAPSSPKKRSKKNDGSNERPSTKRLRREATKKKAILSWSAQIAAIGSSFESVGAVTVLESNHEECLSRMIASNTLCLAVMYATGRSSLEQETKVQVQLRRQLEKQDGEHNSPAYLCVCSDDLVVATKPSRWVVGLVPHSDSSSWRTLWLSRFVREVWMARTSPQSIVAHQAKLVLVTIMRYCGVEECFPCANIFDSQIAAWCLDPDHQHSSAAYELSEIVELYLDSGEQPPSSNSSNNNNNNSNNNDSNSDAKRCFKGLERLLELWIVLRKCLEETKLWTAFSEQEMPTVSILAEMEIRGVGFDVSGGQKFHDELTQVAHVLEVEAHTLAGRNFTLSSTVEVATVLFDELKLSTDKEKTGKSGRRSTKEEVLIELSSQHQLPSIILQHRGVMKCINTYCVPLISAASASHGRLHCTWNQHCTGTGRLSCWNPNLQTIPRTSESVSYATTGNLRSLILPSSGHCFITADYSHMEVRLLAHMCKDRELVTLFNAPNVDLYMNMASKCFDKPVDKCTKDDRNAAKTICLGIMYGMGCMTLARQLSEHRSQPVSMRVAQSMLNKFYAGYPGVRPFMQKVQAYARRDQFVLTMAQRRRYLPEIRHRDANRRSHAERQAVNTVVQGSAADVMKRGVLAIRRGLQSRQVSATRAMLVMQAHDEIVMEVKGDPHSEFVNEVCELVRSSLEGVLVGSRVPFPVNIKVGASFGTLKTWIPPPPTTFIEEPNGEKK